MNSNQKFEYYRPDIFSYKPIILSLGDIEYIVDEVYIIENNSNNYTLIYKFKDNDTYLYEYHSEYSYTCKKTLLNSIGWFRTFLSEKIANEILLKLKNTESICLFK